MAFVADQVTAATFSPLVGDVFRLRFDNAPSIDLELTSVEEYGSNPGADRPAPFSLFFLGPQEPLLPQRIYAFEHDDLGALEIFIVPIAQDESGTRYEAVFN
jgi:hypothetical protein